MLLELVLVAIVVFVDFVLTNEISLIKLKNENSFFYIVLHRRHSNHVLFDCLQNVIWSDSPMPSGFT